MTSPIQAKCKKLKLSNEHDNEGFHNNHSRAATESFPSSSAQMVWTAAAEEPRKPSALVAPDLDTYLQDEGCMMYQPRSEWFSSYCNVAPAMTKKPASAVAVAALPLSHGVLGRRRGHSKHHLHLHEGDHESQSGSSMDEDSGDEEDDEVADVDVAVAVAVHTGDYENTANQHAHAHAQQRSHQHDLPTQPGQQQQQAGNKRHGSSPKRFGKNGDSALHMAICKKATGAAIALLEHGMNPNILNRKAVTPLILAAQEGDLTVIQWLLGISSSPSLKQVIVDPGAMTNSGATAVLQAAHFGHLEILKLLLNYSSTHAGNTNYHMISSNHQLIEVANNNGTTPLMRASQEGHLEIVQYLLQQGALPNRRNQASMSALMLSAQRNHGHICKALIGHGAEVDAVSTTQSTALLLASKRGQLESVKVLVANGAELFHQSDQGKTPLQIATKHERWNLVPYLNPQVQIHLMRKKERSDLVWELVRMYHLYQQKRVTIKQNFYWQYHAAAIIASDNGHAQQQQHDIRAEHMFMQQHYDQHPQQQQQQQAPLILSTRNMWNTFMDQMMTLPSIILEMICEYIPLPNVWDKMISLLTRRSLKDADSAVMSGLDLIDEILEEGGLCDACDIARIPPPEFGSWKQWQAWCRQYSCHVHCSPFTPPLGVNEHQQLLDGNQNAVLGHHNMQLNNITPPIRRTTVTQATILPPLDPSQPTLIELRHQAGYLQVMSHHRSALKQVLQQPPYCMPPHLLDQCINVADLQNLLRRMRNGRGIHVDSPVAVDLIMLCSRLLSWYSREREHM